MFRPTALTIGLLIASLSRNTVAIDKTRDPALVADLNAAATQLDRLALLNNNDAWLFDFTAQQPFYNFAPGGVTNMNAATFPAAKGNSMTSTLAFRTCSLGFRN